MRKHVLTSKTVQGIVLALMGALFGVWAGETELSTTVVLAGLSWAGYGFRDAMK